MNGHSSKIENLDKEWLQLIRIAKAMGLKKEEIREFLQKNGKIIQKESMAAK